MPTLKDCAVSPSASETKTATKSDMSENEALAVEKPSLSAMPTLTANGMTKAEALQITWTGIEALAMMKQANLYRYQKTGRVWIELLATEVIDGNGLKPLAVVITESK